MRLARVVLKLRVTASSKLRVFINGHHRQDEQLSKIVQNLIEGAGGNDIMQGPLSSESRLRHHTHPSACLAVLKHNLTFSACGNTIRR